MSELTTPFRRATPDDAFALASFVNMAGEGLPLYLWTRMATGGESPWDVGCARARRESGAFSYRNAQLHMIGDEPAGCLIGYPLPDNPPPTDYAAMPPMFVPLQQLEDQAPGTWYVNVLAVSERHRGQGIGRGLLALAERLAVQQGKHGLSLIVADSNTGARRLYADFGFREAAQRPMVKEQWDNPGTDWVLMIKPPPRAASSPAPDTP